MRTEIVSLSFPRQSRPTPSFSLLKLHLMVIMSPITEFYKGRTVFVTGATGYMGKVLLEKLVRSLPDLETVYILIRSKKGVSPEERIQILTSNLIFTLNNIDRKCLDKIKPISGDITKEHFDMSESDRRKLIDEVSVVFHLAASIRMDLGLKEAVITNSKSTHELFKFCANITNLVSIVHLSTAFCNVEISYMEEKVYPSNVDPYKVIDLVEWLDDKSIAAIENNLLGPHPNTYTFTKRLSEMIAVDMGRKLPITILRPSIVTPAVYEPTPGWVDNFYGPLGLCTAGGTGILRSTLLDRDLHPQTIPVDVAINSLIIKAYDRATHSYAETPVFHATQGPKYHLSWGEIIDSFMALGRKYPFRKTLWYPRTSTTKNYYLHWFYTVLFHFVPALTIDFLLIIFLQKPFLTSIQQRIFMASKVLYHFVVQKWEFSVSKDTKNNEKLTPEDFKTFYTFDNVDIKKYFVDMFFWTRKHLIKEDIGNVELCRVQLKILYALDVALKLLFSYYTLKLIWRLVNGYFEN